MKKKLKDSHYVIEDLLYSKSNQDDKVYAQRILTKLQKQFNEGRIVFSTNDTGVFEHPKTKNELWHKMQTLYKNQDNYIMDLYVNILEVKSWKNLQDLGLNKFSASTPKHNPKRKSWHIGLHQNGKLLFHKKI